MVIAWPMPISRSRDNATPAMLIDRHEKNADPSTTMTATPSRFSGLVVIATPSTADSTTITAAWTMDRTPAANPLPAIEDRDEQRGLARNGQLWLLVRTGQALLPVSRWRRRSGTAGALQRGRGSAAGLRARRLLLAHVAGATQRRNAGGERQQRHSRGEHDDQAVVERLGDQLREELLPGQRGDVARGQVCQHPGRAQQRLHRVV